MLRRSALAVCSMAVLANAPAIAESATAPPRPPILGLWKGDVSDPSVEKPYGTTIRVKRDGRRFKGSTAYENIDCAGKLKGRKVSKGHYKFTETITENKDFCGEKWIIKVTLRRHHRADWNWSDGLGHSASGRLKRTS